MQKILICALLLAPALAHAEDCRYSAPRNAALDLNGVHAIVVELGRHDLHLNGTAAANAKLGGRACASSRERLPALQVRQRREGDRLVLSAEGDTDSNTFSFFGFSRYAYLDLQLDVPSNLPVEVAVGSGDAWVRNVAQFKTTVGSGDVEVNGARARFEAKVGSGDIKADDVGETHVTSIGSGDLTLKQVHGNVTVGSVGSGDFVAENVQGNVKIDSVGSGDATARTVGGSVEVGSIGSGDLHVDGVARDLHVASVGSGDVEHSHVTGKVDIPKQDD